MIFAEPKLGSADRAVLHLIREQRSRLRFLTQNNPRRWMGSLRRNTFARAIQGSNTIEGYNATMDEAIAAVDEEDPPIDEKTDTWLAINGYRSALTYILQVANDDYFEFGKQFLKSLHFMMTGFDLSAFPGQWRPGPIGVVNRSTGEMVYEAPEARLVDPLIKELVSYIEHEPHDSSVVTAAMAHLNLTMIHPFKDGNGRMARALQTLVLSREGVVYPLFSSIEEWLGRNTLAYYQILADVGAGKWSPHRDALPWIQFCLRAHYQQSNTVIRRIDEAGDLFEAIEAISDKYGLNLRASLPLFDCALGIKLTNSRYQAGAEVTQYIATRELRQLAETGLIEPHGEKRGRYYTAGNELRAAREKIRKKKVIQNPYELPEVSSEAESPRLPGL